MWELESDLGNYVAHQNYTPPTDEDYERKSS